MSELREKLLEAYRAGKLLQKAVEFTFDVQENHDDVTEALVSLHNEGAIDLIDQFKSLRNNQDSGVDFFLTRDLLEKSLPHLNASIQAVMECVAHLAIEAGQDLMANSIFTPFVDFCVADPLRPEQGLEIIKGSPAQFMDFIVSIIVAGTRIDMDQYFLVAIRLTSHEDIEIRKRATFSLGRIQYTGHQKLSVKALEHLERLVGEESDDSLLANTIKSTCSVCMTDKSLIDKGEKIIDLALSKGGDYTLHAAAESFGIDFDRLPQPLLDVIMRHLPRLNPQNKRTIDMIDYGVIKLLKQDNPSHGIEFLEALLLTHAQELSLRSLNSVVSRINRSDRKLLNKLLTRWFLKGDRVLCDGIRIIVDAAHGESMHLEVDPDELPCSDLVHLIFLARKAIGYLFLKPITSASIIISLMRQTSDANIIQGLGSLLFDPLLLNFSGSLHDFLVTQISNESGQTKDVIQEVLDTFDAYLEDLKSMENISEMHPSQEQREAHARLFHQTMSKSFKEAMKGSIVNLICSKSVLLYGRKSINYIQGISGQSQRMEIPMASHGTEIEMPRLSHIDPFGLDYMLRIFRAERLVKA